MEGALFSTPSARFQAALGLATEEYNSGIDLQAYHVVDNSYFPDIYAKQYYSMVESVLDATKKSDSQQELFHRVVDIAKTHAMDASEQGIETAQIELERVADISPSELPEPDEYRKVERLWYNN